MGLTCMYEAGHQAMEATMLYCRKQLLVLKMGHGRYNKYHEYTCRTC